MLQIRNIGTLVNYTIIDKDKSALVYVKAQYRAGNKPLP